MGPNWLAPLLEGAIPFIAGACLTLFGFWKRARPNSTGDVWRTRGADQMKVFGPMLMVIGVALAVREPYRPPAAGPQSGKAWHRLSTSDGAVSVEFPETPQRQDKSVGSAESQQLRVSFPDLAHYTLIEMDLKASPSITDAELIFEQIRAGTEKYWAERRLKATVLGEDQVVIDEVPVREMNFSVGETYLLRIRIVVLGGRYYQAVALTRRNTQQNQESKRFLESLRIFPPKK